MTISVAERAQLRTAVGELLADKCTEADVRRAVDSADGFDRELWRRLAEQGVLGMLVDDDHGGLGFGALELEAVAEETGAALLPAPFISNAVLTVMLVAAAGTKRCALSVCAPRSIAVAPAIAGAIGVTSCQVCVVSAVVATRS